jgi:hypothetical protein
MTCDQMRFRLSMEMDGESSPESSAMACHLSTCADCNDFLATAMEISIRYRGHVRSGIEQLRRAEGVPPWSVVSPRKSRKRRVALLASVAAACFLSWCGREEGKRAVTTIPLPEVVVPEWRPVARASHGLRLFDDLRVVRDDEVGLSLVFQEEPPLPRRLDQDLLPGASADSEFLLPSNLRF